MSTIPLESNGIKLSVPCLIRCTDITCHGYSSDYELTLRYDVDNRCEYIAGYGTCVTCKRDVIFTIQENNRNFSFFKQYARKG